MRSSSQTSEDFVGLTVSGLTLDLRNGRKSKSIFSNFSLAAKNGEIVAILGRSGAGKTTLLNALAGALPFQKGEITFEGAPLELAKSKGKVGYQNQRPLLLPWLTLRQNFEISARVVTHDTGDVETILGQLGLGDVIDRYPNTLSGGMYQRAVFGRIIFVRPSLMLIDEPFSALDEITRLGAYEMLRNDIHARQACCVMVTHDITETLRLADRCVVIAGAPVSIALDLDIDENIRSDERPGVSIALRRKILDALS